MTKSNFSPSSSGIPAILNNRKTGVLFVAILVLGLFAPVFHDVDAIAPMWLAVKYLGLPILGLCFYGFVFMSRPTSLGGWFIGTFFALVFSLLLVRVSVGYLVLANALGPWQGETLVQGRIVDLGESGGKVRLKEVSIVDAAGKRIKLDVGQNEYNRLTVGQAYSARWKVGTLGILYKHHATD